MKYLVSENITIEDFTRFIGSHNGEFVGEQSGIAQGRIDDIDAIVCYPDDAEKYLKFGKKIIRVKALNS